jgi:hypothetical protein
MLFRDDWLRKKLKNLHKVYEEIIMQMGIYPSEIEMATFNLMENLISFKCESIM